jgi:polyhydroxyalkanoate synthase
LSANYAASGAAKTKPKAPHAAAANPASAPFEKWQQNPAELFSDPEFLNTLQAEAEKRTHTALAGLEAFRESEVTYEPSFSKTIWRRGTTELNDYAPDLPDDAPALMLVPSLINRAHIFDLYPQVSVVRYLTAHGVRPLLLDWNEPGIQERRFDCGDYVFNRVAEALNHAQSRFEHLHLLGYCMGGILALAAAQVTARTPRSLILLATPWDMEPFALPAIAEENRGTMREWIMQQDVMPDWWSTALFQLKDPFRFQRKFARFMEMNEREKHHFTQVEHWAQDGVALSRYVARECMLDWPQSNALVNRQWRVGGRIIRPDGLNCRVMTVIPQHDRIVPPDSAEPLAQIRYGRVLRPECGHIGMVAGPQAKTMLWRPVIRWCNAAS